MPTWDPATYLEFGAQRSRPASDLLAQVGIEHPDRIVDVGCGPGNSTALLTTRWPSAEVVGLDTSPEMIARGRDRLPDAEFVEGDLRSWSPPERVDLVFSNATLHWLDDHAGILARLLSWLTPGGVLAVQMPDNFGQPSHRLMREICSSPRWSSSVGSVLRSDPVARPGEYVRLLKNRGSVSVWTTEYLHVLTGSDAVVKWVRGAGLRPVLDRLSPEETDAFVAEYAEAVRDAYPPEPDGTTIFPFRRLFITVRTAASSD